MKELIGFELNKLLRRPLVLASFLGLLLFMGLMLFNWIIPGVNVVQEETDGEWVVLENSDAVFRNQEIAAQYQGPLTVEKVQDVLERYAFSSSAMTSRNMDPARQTYYTHNFLYDIFDNKFSSADGLYNGSTIKEAYGDIAPDLIIGYSDGWENTVYALSYTFLFWCCVLVIILSPVFSEEYTKGTDALILTGNEGRKKCPLAKIIASFIIALAGSLILIGCFFLAFLAYYGTTGFQSSVQLSVLGYLKNTPYVISWGTAFGFACLLWLGAAIVLTAMVLVISVLAKNSFSSLVISFVLFMAPMFVPGVKSHSLLYLVCSLMPVNQLVLYHLFSFNTLPIGVGELKVMWLAVPVSVAAVTAGTLLSKKSFAHHQVM